MRSDKSQGKTRWKTAAATFTFVLALTGGLPAAARAQVPSTAELYGVHETVVQHAVPTVNPFRDLVLNATYQGPSGQVVNFWGFYDGDGAGGMSGTVWKIRFMPTAVGNWTVSWSFSDGTGSGSGAFLVSDTGIPGPAKLDPANNKFLADARGNPIHWRGYGIKHGAKALDAPPFGMGLQPQTVFDFVQNVIDNGLIAGGYNAAYVTVPAGWRQPGHPLNGTCNPFGTQLDCPLWGDYNFYSLRASHVFDFILNHLHQNRIWTVGWITFGLQQNSVVLSNPTNYQPLMRYFVARYGAYYNYFMWSPMWETWELSGYVPIVNQMMSYLTAIDPWHRLQGVHDEAQWDWQGWQRVQPRQHPVQTRTIFDGNNRKIGLYQGPTTGISPRPAPLGYDYPFVILGAETLWEFCNGSFGKPQNGTEVRRGLAGELFAGVLPIYDEWFENDASGPCGGLGNGEGDGIVQVFLNWWYATVNYRNPAFTMLNNLTGAGQILSGIPGQEYVLYRQDAGVLTINLSGVPATSVFSVTAIDAVTGVQLNLGTINGGAPISAPSPFAGDTLVFVKKL